MNILRSATPREPCVNIARTYVYIYLCLLGYLDTGLRILSANTTILFTDGWSTYYQYTPRLPLCSITGCAGNNIPLLQLTAVSWADYQRAIYIGIIARSPYEPRIYVDYAHIDTRQLRFERRAQLS